MRVISDVVVCPKCEKTLQAVECKSRMTGVADDETAIICPSCNNGILAYQEEEHFYWIEQNLTELGREFLGLRGIECSCGDTAEIVGQIYYDLVVYYDLDVRAYMTKNDIFIKNRNDKSWKEALALISEGFVKGLKEPGKEGTLENDYL